MKGIVAQAGGLEAFMKKVCVISLPSGGQKYVGPTSRMFLGPCNQQVGSWKLESLNFTFNLHHKLFQSVQCNMYELCPRFKPSAGFKTYLHRQ
jgi:hypothetical protein